MKFSEIYESAELGETFQPLHWHGGNAALQFVEGGRLVRASDGHDVYLSLSLLRAADWVWVKRHPRCEKCGQKLPEGWTAPKQRMSLVEIAKQWQEGDLFTTPDMAETSVWPLHFSPKGSLYTPGNCFWPTTREDLTRTDWYFTNRCRSCGQRIGGKGE